MSKETDRTKPGRTISSVETGFAILEKLQELDGAGATELTEYFDLSKSTLHIYLITLQNMGYVIKNGNVYKPSLKLLELGYNQKANQEINTVVEFELNRLHDVVKEVCEFMVEEEGLGVYLHRVGHITAVQTETTVGTRRGLHCTALGKAILAHYSTDRVHQILDQHSLPKKTENTITNRTELLKELDEIRNSLVAFSNEESYLNLREVAAPVKSNGEVIGAVGVIGPSTRFGKKYVENDLADEVLTNADVISSKISN